MKAPHSPVADVTLTCHLPDAGATAGVMASFEKNVEGVLPYSCEKATALGHLQQQHHTFTHMFRAILLCRQVQSGLPDLLLHPCGRPAGLGGVVQALLDGMCDGKMPMQKVCRTQCGAFVLRRHSPLGVDAFLLELAT
jgi:hypothetical protein